MQSNGSRQLTWTLARVELSMALAQRDTMTDHNTKINMPEKRNTSDR